MTAISIFNRQHVLQRRAHATREFAEFRFLHDWCERDILDRLSIIRRDFPTAAILNDRSSDDFKQKLKTAKNITSLTSVMDENEYIPHPPASLDLLISIIDLHTINDLPGMLVQIRQCLKPDGLFIACMPGGETLYELRAVLMEAELSVSGGASPRVFPFADKQQMGSLLQRGGFALPVVDSDIIRVSYRNLFHLMDDLRGMGESNVIAARRKTFTPRSFFSAADQTYAQKFKEADGKITASFEIISLIGWAPHASQQQPQRPGSATARLAAVLGTEEFKTE